MASIEKEIIIKNAQGLHARPAAQFVQIASKFDSDVSLCKDGEEVNGRSIMGILTLGAQQFSKVIIKADGVDADEVVSELCVLLETESE